MMPYIELFAWIVILTGLLSKAFIRMMGGLDPITKALQESIEESHMGLISLGVNIGFCLMFIVVYLLRILG